MNKNKQIKTKTATPYFCIYILYIYIQKLKSQKLDVLEWILNKKHIFKCHKYFSCFK